MNTGNVVTTVNLSNLKAGVRVTSITMFAVEYKTWRLNIGAAIFRGCWRVLFLFLQPSVPFSCDLHCLLVSLLYHPNDPVLLVNLFLVVKRWDRSSSAPNGH